MDAMLKDFLVEMCNEMDVSPEELNLDLDI